MAGIDNFAPGFAELLPETCAILQGANLTVHPLITRVVLHGSRGRAGGFRPGSDLDLSLIAGIPGDIGESEREQLCHAAWQITFSAWQSPVEPDLAVIFDTRSCGLLCFEQTHWQEDFCHIGGVDCFGIYKVQKGFHGLVTNAGIQVRRMYPCVEIWRRGA